MPRIDWPGSVRRGWLFLAIATVVIALDQISKLFIRNNLALHDSIPISSHLNIVHWSNTGSAFGLFSNQTFLLSLVAIAGLIVILLFYRYFSESSTLSGPALGMIFGGAAGNLIDRFHLGYVIDFIDVRLWHDTHWPAFNIADSAITIGTIVLAFFLFLTLKKENDHSTKTKS